MVASIASISSASASTQYFAQDGYYMDGSEEQTMAWHGKGAIELLGEGQKVTPDTYRAIMEGHVPGTDIRLGRTRNGQHEHKPGTDVTFSAPKSVSLAAFISKDDRVIQAHQQAVAKTLNYIEKDILESRKYSQETGLMEKIKGQKMVAATFQHDTSRNLDPQLHTHATIANMALGEDGKWRTIENRSLYNNKMLIGAHYHNELAAGLKELGYGIEKTGKNGQFDITHADGKALYSKEVLDAFSTRSAEIKEAMRHLQYNTGDPVTKAKAALLTRNPKDNPDREAVAALWQEQTQKLGIDGVKVKPSKSASLTATQTADAKTPDAIEVVEWACRHLEERSSVFTKKDLLTAALTRDIGSVDINSVNEAITTLTDEKRLVEAQTGREEGFTTDRAIKTERENIDRMEKGQGASAPIYSQSVIDQHLDRTTLTSGQQEAVHTILDSNDRVVGVQGYAGSGKTTMLSTAREIAEERGNAFWGKEVSFIGLAPSASAARTLETEAGVESKTLQSFLAQHSAISEGRANEGMISQMKEGVKDSVIIVDEASMISSSQMRDLLRVTDALQPSRLVLVGDSKQLDAVNAGQPFDQLQHAGMETAVMDQIMRQRDENLRGAVIDALSGAPAEALARLDKDVIEVSRDELAKTAADSWLMLSPEAQENTGVMAPTHALRDGINERIRSELALDGVLHGETAEITQLVSARLTEAEKEVAGNYHAGNAVIFEQGVSSLGVEAGELFEVSGRAGDTVLLEGKDGETIAIDPTGGIAPQLEVYETAAMELQAGDIIRWTRNDAENGLINTHQADVTAVTDGNIHLTTEDGRQMVFSAEDGPLQHSDYAFNATVHAFQGRTMDNVIAVLDSTHQELTTQKTFYVEISRAKDSATLITDDKDGLAITLEQNTGEQTSALEGISSEPRIDTSIDERLHAAIDTARMEMSGVSFEEHEALNAGAPEHSTDDYVDSGDWGSSNDMDYGEREMEHEL